MLQAFVTARPCRILSIGCGGSPDLRTVIDHVPASATIVLCDGDKDALSYSRAKLDPIADRCHLVPGMFRGAAQGPRLRAVRPHSRRRAVRLSVRPLHRADAVGPWAMLAPAGRIVFTNIATGNPFRVWIEYMGDWKLIERSEEDIDRICETAKSAPVIVRDATSLAISRRSGRARARGLQGMTSARSTQPRSPRPRAFRRGVRRGRGDHIVFSLRARRAPR